MNWFGQQISAQKYFRHINGETLGTILLLLAGTMDAVSANSMNGEQVYIRS